MDQAVEAARLAREEPKADEIDDDPANGQDATLPVVEVLESEVVASALDGEEDLHFDSYQFADISENVVGEKLSDELIERIRALTVAIVEIEGPVHKDLVIERIRLLYALGRVRGSTREHVSRGITSAVRAKAVEWLPEKIKGRKQEQVFLRMGDDTTPIRPRVSADEKYRRSIEHIPLEEIKAGVMICARLMYGAARDDLVAETTRRFGFKRTGVGIRARVGEAVDQLVREGSLTGNAKMLSTGD